jgi:hypothetical protein
MPFSAAETTPVLIELQERLMPAIIEVESERSPCPYVKSHTL